jgi:hypothetical protein
VTGVKLMTILPKLVVIKLGEVGGKIQVPGGRHLSGEIMSEALSLRHSAEG